MSDNARPGKQMDTYIVEAEPRSARHNAIFTVVGGIDAGRILSVSREQVSMLVIGPDYIFKDAGSRNGSYVNDVRIAGPVKLRHGDRVQLGSSTVLRFTIVDEQEEETLKRVYEAAVRDGLTGVYNRIHFEERLASELAFALRHDTSLSVIIFDVDHFKRVNDTFGHLVGDTVLKTFANLLSQGLRAEDMVARYGGEEFVILSRGVDVATATQIADRLRWSVASTPMNVGTQMIQVTVSAGVASLACCGAKQDRETLLGLADQRLYQAKQAGRNRVVGG